jgi:hypothetical protein
LFIYSRRNAAYQGRKMLDRPALLLIVGVVATAAVVVGLGYAFPGVGPPGHPIAVLSMGFLPITTPGGPVLKLVVENVGSNLVVRLSATLELEMPFNITFPNVTAASPFGPGVVASTTGILVGPWQYTCGEGYPLEFGGSFSDGAVLAENVRATLTCPPGW